MNEQHTYGEERRERKRITFSGTLLYSEPSNPYETIEVYWEETPEFVVKSYISEHGPDGCSSWEVLSLSPENAEKLRQTASGSLKELLAGFWESQNGMISLRQYLTSHDIPYQTSLYM